MPSPPRLPPNARPKPVVPRPSARPPKRTSRPPKGPNTEPGNLRRITYTDLTRVFEGFDGEPDAACRQLELVELVEAFARLSAPHRALGVSLIAELRELERKQAELERLRELMKR